MLEQSAFHFGAVNIFTAAQHHIFGAVDNEYKTLIIHARNIAGAQPAALNTLSRGFIAIEIAFNDITAFDAKLAGFAIWQIIAISINHFAFQSRHKRAAAFRLVDKICPQNRGDDAACFGHAIAGAGFAIGQGAVNFADQIGLQLRATAAQHGQ